MLPARYYWELGQNLPQKCKSIPFRAQCNFIYLVFKKYFPTYRLNVVRDEERQIRELRPITGIGDTNNISLRSKLNITMSQHIKFICAIKVPIRIIILPSERGVHICLKPLLFSYKNIIRSFLRQDNRPGSADLISFFIVLIHCT